MHEHEVSDAAQHRPKPRSEPASAETGLLALQQQAGNRAVARELAAGSNARGLVARSVIIEDLEATTEPPDQEEQSGWTPHGPGSLESRIEEIDEAAGEKPGPTPDTLPPGGHAPMEQEPS